MKHAPFLCCAAFFLVSCVSAVPGRVPLVADMDPVPVGTAVFETEKTFSSALEQKQAAALFDPRTDTVRLQFSYQTITFRQFWDRAARDRFKAALERYENDFESQNLRKSSKSRQAYGSAMGKVEWGQFSFNINARGSVVMDMGYLFKKDNPYFTVLQREARDTIFGGRESPRITVYFTRAHAAALAALFDQDALLSRLDIKDEPTQAVPHIPLSPLREGIRDASK